MKYFYDAVGADYDGSLTYRKVEGVGDMEKHPTVHEDVENAVGDLLQPLAGRKKVLFACRENACRSQMAGAFARMLAGDRLDVMTAGSEPTDKVNPDMVKVMQEERIDMAFLRPRSLEEAIELSPPDFIFTMGCGENCPVVPGARVVDWDLADPAGQSVEFMRDVRDRIRDKVEHFIGELG
jgi:protein-tyrosine-phosphatase